MARRERSSGPESGCLAPIGNWSSAARSSTWCTRRRESRVRCSGRSSAQLAGPGVGRPAALGGGLPALLDEVAHPGELEVAFFVAFFGEEGFEELRVDLEASADLVLGGDAAFGDGEVADLLAHEELPEVGLDRAGVRDEVEVGGFAVVEPDGPEGELLDAGEVPAEGGHDHVPGAAQVHAAPERFHAGDEDCAGRLEELAGGVVAGGEAHAAVDGEGAPVHGGEEVGPMHQVVNAEDLAAWDAEEDAFVRVEALDEVAGGVELAGVPLSGPFAEEVGVEAGLDQEAKLPDGA